VGKDIMDKSLLAVVIMVKDEGKVIENTLLPFVEHGIMNFCVFDTGSTDDTVEKTTKFFEKHNLNGVIGQKPFIDFAASRNDSLDFAEKNFPDVTFFLSLDSDWYIQNLPGLIAFCESKVDETHPVYGVRVRAQKVEIISPRIFRVSEKIRYTGVVHEETEEKMGSWVDEDVYFILSETREHLRKTRSRFARDLKLLQEFYKKNPLHTRTMFYLAQTHECLGDAKNAYKFYLKRSGFKINSEEDAVTFFRLGYIAESLSTVDPKFTWSLALEYYLKAFSRRYTRIEPLVAIGAHYLKESPQISFVYLEFACRLEYPKNDSMFVQKHIYDFMRYDLLSGCAYAVKEYSVGLNATQKALKVDPTNKRLLERAKIYNVILSEGDEKTTESIFGSIPQTPLVVNALENTSL